MIMKMLIVGLIAWFFSLGLIFLGVSWFDVPQTSLTGFIAGAVSVPIVYFLINYLTNRSLDGEE